MDTSFGTAQLVSDRTRPSLTTLYLDGVPSSAIDAADPSYLEFEYMQHMRLLIDALFPPPAPLRALHLGAAACALPNALEADRPNSRQLAVEADKILAARVRDWFDLPRSPRLRIRVGDGRRVLDSQAGRGWQIIVRDAFIAGHVPVHLQTLEAAASARAALADDGAYIVNAGANVKEELAALLLTFKHVVALGDPAVYSGKRLGNITIGASQRPWPNVEREVRKLPLPVRVFSGLVPSAAPFHDARGAADQSPREPGEPGSPPAPSAPSSASADA
ncbi:MAG: fused MFS/spermidine synthase [Flaviflexus sp.]|nr:fused MFS/spermidine synthase [Flaviflexus sp.]